MFNNYYSILDIPEYATNAEVRSAFKKQAKKWHPDVNKSFQAEERMKLINEAYLILQDIEARQRYDDELSRYKSFIKFSSNQHKLFETDSEEERILYENYEISDSVLKKWIINAIQQSKELAGASLKDLIEMSSKGIAAAIEEIKFSNKLIGILAIVFLLLYLILLFYD